MNDPLLDKMLETQYHSILECPRDFIGYAVAYIQIGASLKEAQMMKEMFCAEKTDSNPSLTKGD